MEALLTWLSNEYPSFTIFPKAWKSIGKGVVFQLESSELKSVHGAFQQQFKKDLTAQDAQGLWPHISIQNKVSSAEAKKCLVEVQQLVPPTIKATGISIWFYDGGPWEFIRDFEFSD